MSARVLVAYATKHGSVREVADTIAETLADEGLIAEVRAAAEVDEVEPYALVVLGGSLYMTRWHADAIRFLRRHAGALRGRALAVYAMGPATLEEHDVAAAREQLERALRKAPDAEPVEVAVFGGVIDPSRLRFPFSRMPASDARDPRAIGAWARRLAEVAGGRVAAGR